MDIKEILEESTHFRTSHAGISFATAETCENCGTTAFVNWSPWCTFPGISILESAVDARLSHGMIECKDEYPNELYYSDDTPSSECCNECC
jgi:hypothetical protein